MNKFLGHYIRSPLAGYLGGKHQLAKRIIQLFPEHTCYCEVFAGAAWVFFRKIPSEVEVINDINSDVVTLYRVVQHHLEEFIRYFKWVLVSRDEFARYIKENPNTLTDIQRSVRFFYLQRAGFGGRGGFNGGSFGTATTRPPRLDITRIGEDLSDAHLRLSRVYIENLPYADLITRYDRDHTFFYIDPPYWNCESDYGKHVFSKNDFTALATQLAGIKGKFLLSLNDVPEIREIFSDFIIEQVDVTYSTGKVRKPVKEVLIRNY